MCEWAWQLACEKRRGLGTLVACRDKQAKGKKKELEEKKNPKLEPNNLCTRSEIQKDEESRKEMGTAEDYVQCQAKPDRRSTTPVLVPSAICG